MAGTETLTITHIELVTPKSEDVSLDAEKAPVYTAGDMVANEPVPQNTHATIAS